MLPMGVLQMAEFAGSSASVRWNPSQAEGIRQQNYAQEPLELLILIAW